jgi:predicted metal-binding protein
MSVHFYSSFQPSPLSKHTLFICKSCHRSEEERPKGQPADGKVLLGQLTSRAAQMKTADLDVKPVGCLWACSRGCVVALASSNKLAYLLSDLPLEGDYAEALLQTTQLDIKSKKGSFNWEKMPKLLESCLFAQIPALPAVEIASPEPT